MKYAFFFGDVAVTVSHWLEHGRDGDERGARVEIQRAHWDTPEHVYSVRGVTLREGIWRGDLFSHLAGPPGNWDRAHHHTGFDGATPLERRWDPALKADPAGWTVARLADLKGVLTAAGHAGQAAGIDEDEVRDALPAMRAAIEACMREPRPAVSGQARE